MPRPPRSTRPYTLLPYPTLFRSGVDAVVEAVPALAEEEVAAHLAGQLGLGLAHLRLDQRVPGLPHQRAAAVTQGVAGQAAGALDVEQDHRRSEEHTSELQSLMRISYAVFRLKKKKNKQKDT